MNVSKVVAALDVALMRAHGRARNWAPFQRLAVISRILLAVAFLPTGLVKLLGLRFTLLGPDTAVGAFFEAMYQTGYYWRFLGAGQVTAAILLLIPATSTLGAVLFFPIVLNITVITFAVHFKGTTYVTALMLLASVFLLCWDWHRLRSIVFSPAVEAPAPSVPLTRVERVAFGVGCGACLVFFAVLRGLVPTSLTIPAMLTGGAAALVVLVEWIRLARR